MINALIIDDEEDAREMLHLALKRYCPNVEVVARCESAEIGLKKINELHPDLVFLDVQMPRMSGFDMLAKIPQHNFEVIFVTAYNQYAIKAIKFSALDYLLKPIDVDELVLAVNRLGENARKYNKQYHTLLPNMRLGPKKLTRLAIPTENEILLQQVDQIVYCKADGSYTELHMHPHRKIVVSKNIKEFENMLSENAFCRIHHSILVNTAHIKKYIKGEGGYVVVTGDVTLNVSRRKKDGLVRMLANL